MRASVLPLVLVLAACQEYTSPLKTSESEVEPVSSAVAGSVAAGVGGPAARPSRGDRWIVVLPDGVPADDVARENGITPDHVYRRVINGFAGSMSELARNRLLADRRVLMIERDEVVHTTNALEQRNAPWGLDRVDQRTLPRDGVYRYATTASNVTAYIVDTGIRYSHVDFGGRARKGYDVFGGDGSDCNGHGTHVAGTVGGSTYGVAKAVHLVSIRVLDCGGSGSASGVIAGLDWILANAARPAVVNMSLGGSAISVLDDAVQRVIDAGITVVVAAGNMNSDACTQSPARVPAAITVGATDTTDMKSGFSNHGPCVDIFAPGRSILSTWNSDNTAAAFLSGTSMASPHVAGAAALVLAGSTGASPATVTNVIMTNATKNIVTSASTDNNHLLFTNAAVGETIGNQPPQAHFAFVCTELTCSFADESTDSDGIIASWAWSFGDGSGSAQRNPSRTYGAAGSYQVTLTVADNAGAQASYTATVRVDVTPNQTPSAQFDVSCLDLVCAFSDLSTDPDGSIARWNWSFGDGGAFTSANPPSNPSYAYGASGTYEVRLVVTDNAGASAEALRSVTVSGIGLAAGAFKEKGLHKIALNWAGAAGSKVDVFANGAKVGTPNNTGSWTYATNGRGQGTYVMKVCETAGGRCSAEQTVRF